MPAITAVLIEDETLLRTLLRKAMEAAGRFRILGEAEDGEQGLALCRSVTPEMVLLDIQLPKVSGVELARIISQELKGVKIIALSAQRNPATIQAMLEAGVHGYVDKRQTLELLMKAIVEVAEGGRYFSKDALEVLGGMIKTGGQREAELSVREKEVLKLLAQGLTNKGVAFELSISELTVKTHRQNIHKKLNIHDTAALTRYAMECGLL